MKTEKKYEIDLDTPSGAYFSPDRIHRYALWRNWKPKPKKVLFMCLNPSTADETQDDPTCRRCINYAKSWGYGGFIMTNIFALRSTDPKGLRRSPDPVGAWNDAWLFSLVRTNADLIICAWGNHGSYLHRSSEVKRLLQTTGRTVHYLKLTGQGEPSHPLYLPADLKPKEWSL